MAVKDVRPNRHEPRKTFRMNMNMMVSFIKKGATKLAPVKPEGKFAFTAGPVSAGPVCAGPVRRQR